MTELDRNIEKACELLRKSRRAVAFTGAGISVESGIAPFRGPGGLWETHDPAKFEYRYFRNNPADSWDEVKRLFYDHMGKAEPNPAHLALAELERQGKLMAVITQNVDGLHHAAGSREVYEYHGSLRKLECQECKVKIPYTSFDLNELPPLCPHCDGIMKPDIVFFGEPIPEYPLRMAAQAVESCDLMLVIGSTGEVQPAARLPHLAKNRAGASIIEVNVRPSSFTDRITDIFLQAPAGKTLSSLATAALS